MTANTEDDVAKMVNLLGPRNNNASNAEVSNCLSSAMENADPSERHTDVLNPAINADQELCLVVQSLTVTYTYKIQPHLSASTIGFHNTAVNSRSGSSTSCKTTAIAG